MSECLGAGGSGSVEKKMVPSLPLLSCELSVSVKENFDRKKRRSEDLLLNTANVLESTHAKV